MKGVLYFDESSKKWVVEYNEDGRTILIDVRPGRIDDLNRVGVYLQNLHEVDFHIENTHEFPYRWAVPYVASESNTKPEPKKKTIQKKRITLWLSGFHTDEIEIECDKYDASSSGYYYFIDRESNNGETKYIGCYPVNRTIIHEIKEIEVEI